MSLSTFGGFVSFQPLGVELCSVHAAFPISGRLWRCEHCKALCFAGGHCVACSFFNLADVQLKKVSILWPKNAFCVVATTTMLRVESVLSDVLFPSFRNTTAVQTELNVTFPYDMFRSQKNTRRVRSLSSKSQFIIQQNRPGFLHQQKRQQQKTKKHPSQSTEIYLESWLEFFM